MSCCIVHDYVIDSATIFNHWASVIGIGIISLVQFLDILVPNLLFGGAYDYYGIAGSGFLCRLSFLY